jgi:aspartyl-tRNA(Asn)/glutamyl-tRNA(Gln) amidotransferase subunit A
VIDFQTIALADLAGMVRAGKVSSRELVMHALDMIDRTKVLNAWVLVDAERALESATAIDDSVAAGRPVGSLAGIPIGVKDLEPAAGFRTAYGSLLNAADEPETGDSVLVARLRGAGCVVLGKTTTPEVGFKGDTVSPLTGATLSPYDVARSPGGSSGGTAAALAAGVVPLATGSDGGGSIRIPGSLCGLSAVKPSHGRVPLGGPTPPNAGILSVKGPMALRTRDVAFALSVCVGPDPIDHHSLPAAEFDWSIPSHVALPERVVWAPHPDFPVDAGVAAACDTAIGRLEAAGTEVVVVESLFHSPPLLDWWTLWTAYRNRAHGHLRSTAQWELIDQGLRDTMDYAERHVGPNELLKAFDSVPLYNHDIASVLARAPFLLTPTVAGETAHSDRSGTIDGAETQQWAPFTQVCNMTRHPAGSVPAGTTADGFPVGIQIIGPHHADIPVLHAMAALEELWADLTPPLPSW